MGRSDANNDPVGRRLPSNPESTASTSFKSSRRFTLRDILLTFGHNLVDLVLGPLLPARERVQLRLRHDHFFVRTSAWR